MSTTPEPTGGATSQAEEDYWTPEPIENEAVAEWFEQQPESRQGGGAR